MDILWILIAALLVFMMQAGFLCLESGLVRSKNSINVAAKNISDFMLASAIYWTVGFAIMFGESAYGWFGTTGFMFGDDASPRLIATFLFQMMFCGTAATLVSGAVAERMSYAGYLVVTATICLFIYPFVGHWVWAGVLTGSSTGWLEQLGFIDFAGSTVVHSVGGWVALAAILVIGPRIGRFGETERAIPGSNLPMAVVGCMFLWFGWFGFNGGSTLAWNQDVPAILLNTMLAAVMGGISATILKFLVDGYVDLVHIINGVLGGLVAITASCFMVSSGSAALIGIVAGVIVYLGSFWLEKNRIDDAIGVVPVHLFAGIWGTLAVAIFGDLELFTVAATRSQQFQLQVVGVIAVGAYSFVIAYLIFRIINYFYPLRVSEQTEIMGLNVTEHRVSTEVFDLLSAMDYQKQESNFSNPVPVEPHTEVGQIAQQYNRVLNRVNQEILQRDEALVAVKQSEYRNGAILNAAMDSIVTINSQGEIREFNPAAEQCFGTVRRRMLGRNFFELFMDDESGGAAQKSLQHGFTLGDGLVLRRQNITELTRLSGESFPAELVVTRTTDSSDRQIEYTLHIRDITRQNRLRSRLKTLAFEDVLTGLNNRTYVLENLKQRIQYHRQTSGLVALLYLDIDQFKRVNDTFGHKAGDELLCEFSDRLLSQARSTDLVGRWGGDEFVVVFSGDIDINTVTARASQLLEALRQPATIANHQLRILASIGIAVSIDGEVDADQLLQRADMAMYSAKQAGRNNFRIFADEMEHTAQKHSRYTLALPEAIEQKQFYLQYQPKITCKSDELIGMEALIRWQHPEYGLISPADFIPLIDESNLIVEIGEWVLTKVVLQLVEWRRNGYELVPVAVNISGHHMHDPSLVSFVKEITEQHEIPCELIEMEITEGVLTGDTEESISAMAALNEIKIKLSIDDFGTGYSSLSYLKKFPIHILKIDRAFINECATNSDDAAICKAIITLAKSLGLQVVAEGVETEEQLLFLNQQGCDFYQGYYYSRPLNSDQIPSILDQGNIAPAVC